MVGFVCGVLEDSVFCEGLQLGGEILFVQRTKLYVLDTLNQSGCSGNILS